MGWVDGLGGVEMKVGGGRRGEEKWKSIFLGILAISIFYSKYM